MQILVPVGVRGSGLCRLRMDRLLALRVLAQFVDAVIDVVRVEQERVEGVHREVRLLLSVGIGHQQAAGIECPDDEQYAAGDAQQGADADRKGSGLSMNTPLRPMQTQIQIM